MCLLVLVLLLNSNVHSNMMGVTTTPTNYITFFTDYASNNARKKITYYAGSSARILAASLAVFWLTLGACARVTVLALSFGRSVCLSVCLSLLLQRSAIASTRQLRYEQAKHDHGLQCDSWILLKCFRS